MFSYGSESVPEHFTLIHLVEEIGELSSQYVSQRIRKKDFDSDKLDNAIADIFMQAVSLAHQRGLDIEKLITDTIRDERQLLTNGE